MKLCLSHYESIINQAVWPLKCAQRLIPKRCENAGILHSDNCFCISKIRVEKRVNSRSKVKPNGNIGGYVVIAATAAAFYVWKLSSESVAYREMITLRTHSLTLAARYSILYAAGDFVCTAVLTHEKSTNLLTLLRDAVLFYGRHSLMCSYFIGQWTHLDYALNIELFCSLRAKERLFLSPRRFSSIFFFSFRFVLHILSTFVYLASSFCLPSFVPVMSTVNTPHLICIRWFFGWAWFCLAALAKLFLGAIIQK